MLRQEGQTDDGAGLGGRGTGNSLKVTATRGHQSKKGTEEQRSCQHPFLPGTLPRPSTATTAALPSESKFIS